MGRSVFELYEEHLERSTYLDGIDPAHLCNEGLLSTALLMITDGIRALQCYCVASDGVLVVLVPQENKETKNVGILPPENSSIDRH